MPGKRHNFFLYGKKQTSRCDRPLSQDEAPHRNGQTINYFPYKSGKTQLQFQIIFL